MAFAALRQQDKLSESEWESFLPDGKDKGRCRGFQVISLCMVVVVVIFVASVISTNLIAKSAIEAVATYAFGVKTGVGTVAFSAFSGSSSVNDMRIDSPKGFGEDLMHLKRGVFDIGFWSVVGHTILSVGTPFELQEIRIIGLHVILAQELDGTSNAGLVLNNMLQVDASHAPPPNTRAMQTRLIVQKVSLENISAAVEVQPVSRATGPLTFGLNSVLLTSVGENSGGVTLEELLKDIVKVVLGAVIHHTGGDMKERIMNGLGTLKDSVMSIPHAKEIYCDAGKGLEKVHEWADEAKVQLESQLSPMVNYTQERAEAIGGMLSNVSAEVLPQVSAGVSSAIAWGGGLFHSSSDSSTPADASGISEITAAGVGPLRSQLAVIDT